ncbi:MAG: hypothetical protein J5971_00940 [Prevotella sp.]|nr:hypothetical protein [Prevotella sp.]
MENEKYFRGWGPTDPEHRNGCGGPPLLIVIVVAVLLAGCKQIEYVNTERARTDTLYQVKERRDSIKVHDSVYVKEFRKGDTVFVIRDRWKLRFRDCYRIDTVYKSRTDTLRAKERMEVEKPRGAWERFATSMGNMFVLAFLFFMALVALRGGRDRRNL